MVNEQKTCVILGANGFIGSALSAEASRRDYKVIPLSSATDYDEFVGDSDLSKANLAIFAAGNSKKFLSARDPQKDFRRSVCDLHDFVFDVAMRSNRAVLISTGDIYADHENPENNTEDAPIDVTKLSPYGIRKRVAEELFLGFMKEKGTIFRMGGFVGPNLRKNAVYDLLKGNEIRVNPASQYQYIDTRDSARTVFELAERAQIPPVINLTGQGTMSLEEIVRMFPQKLNLDNVSAETRKKQPEVYNMNLDLVKSLVGALPNTRETVNRFIQEVLSGQIELR